jgi:hypothetical protein
MNEFIKLFPKVAEFINKKYDENDVAIKVDEQMMDYLDDDWKDDGYKTEYEWYQNFGRGEAEGDIHNEIMHYVRTKFDEEADEMFDILVVF